MSTLSEIGNTEHLTISGGSADTVFMSPQTTDGAPLLEGHRQHLERRGLSPNTIRHYSRIVRRAQDRAPLDEHTAATLSDYVFNRPTSVAQRRLEIAALASFYDWACNKAEPPALLRDPTKRLVRPKRPRRLPRPITEQEYRFLLKRAREKSPRTFLLCALAGSAGLRCIGISRLRGIDVTESALHVHGKGDRWRVVPIGETVEQALEEFGAREVDGRLIPHHPNYVSKLFTSFARRHGVDVTAHQLRHRFATAVYRATGDLLVVRDLLGHADVTSTQIYTRLVDDRKAHAVNKLPV